MGYYSEKTREKYRKIVIDYLRENPAATCKQIKTNTKAKIRRIFENGLRQAYEEARVPVQGYLTRRNREEQVRDALEFILSNPGCTVTHIQDITGICLPRIIGTMKKAYEMVGVEYPKRGLSSSANSEIRKRAYAFEDKIIKLLQTQGEVVKYYKTANGVADALIKINGEKILIEVKDYRSKNNITLSEIKQLNRYIKGLDDCNKGYIITQPNSIGLRSKIYIDGNEINIISYEEIQYGSVA